jgi:tRNA (Thr-GGU) A37 N-methylase
MKDIFATDQKARPNNIPQRYVEYTSINVGITKFNDNAAITGLLCSSIHNIISSEYEQ